jgi:hypothetical protein
MKLNLSTLAAVTAGLLAVPAHADVPKGYISVPGIDTAIQLYGNACMDVVMDQTGQYGVMAGLAEAGATDNSVAKNQWDMTLAESRFGMRTITPSEWGDIKTRMEFDFFGATNPKSSRETAGIPHLRQMYGEVNGFLAGITDSNFEDPDGSPNYIDQEGLLADWFGSARWAQLRYTANLNPNMFLAVAIERDDNSSISGTNPNGTLVSSNNPFAANPNPYTSGALKNTTTHDIPGAFTGRLNYSDKWGHICFALGYDQWSQFGYTGTKGTPSASTHTWSKDVFSWALSGHFQFGDDQLTYHYGVGAGQNGATLEDGVVWAADGSLQVINANQFEAGYDHMFNSKWEGNLFLSHVGYSRDANKGMTGSAFESYDQYGGNVLWHPTRTIQYGVEYLYGVAKTFDSNTLTNLDGSTESAVHESRIHFQFKYKFN